MLNLAVKLQLTCNSVHHIIASDVFGPFYTESELHTCIRICPSAVWIINNKNSLTKKERSWKGGDKCSVHLPSTVDVLDYCHIHVGFIADVRLSSVIESSKRTFITAQQANTMDFTIAVKFLLEPLTFLPFRRITGSRAPAAMNSVYDDIADTANHNVPCCNCRPRAEANHRISTDHVHNTTDLLNIVYTLTTRRLEITNN